MKEKLQEKLLQIESKIDSVMPESVDRLWLERATGSFSKVGDLSQVQTFIDPGRDLLKRGGKRWRPLVLVLLCESLGGGEKGYPLIPLVEIPHNASLIVDDIEDKSEERRGKPAIHKIYGNDVAINTGNLMYFLPTYIIDKLDITSEKRNRIFSGFLEDMRRLHFGQGLDILWHNQNDFIPEEEDYLQMCRYKTGSLARMSARLGAIAADQNDDVMLKCAEIWENAGVGFQILDDVKNLSTGNPGKMQGDDIVEGKRSLPVIYHCRKGLYFQNELIPLLGSSHKEDIQKAINAIQSSGALDMAKEKGVSLLLENRDKLHKILPSGESLDLLRELLDNFISKMA